MLNSDEDDDGDNVDDVDVDVDILQKGKQILDVVYGV